MRWGMVIDLARCVGCQTCTIACKLENATPPGVYWRQVLDIENGAYPKVRRVFLPLQCMHCVNPPCMYVCPTKATRRRDDGIVYVDYRKCIGCGYCVLACPYRARWLIREKKWYFGDGPTEPEMKTFDPERLGVCTKCTFCMHRIDEAMRNGGRPGADPGATPACVNSCNAKAITFGDLDDPESEVSKIIGSRPSFRLLEHLGTEPSVYYVW